METKIIKPAEREPRPGGFPTVRGGEEPTPAPQPKPEKEAGAPE
jgi:hypothetical protein